jgi:hypothetical protein
MTRHIGKLSALFVSKVTKPRLYNDGGNLYLQVRSPTAKSWIFRFDGGRYLGLGSAHVVSLQEARDLAHECRRLRQQGIDPIGAKHAKQTQQLLDKATKAMTFKQCVAAYIDAHRAGWKHHKHLEQWRNSMTRHVVPLIGDLPVQAIDTAAVHKVLQPIWTAIPETAGRLRGRIELVLGWARVLGYRDGENPARWRGHLDKLLPKPGKVRRIEHFAAMPYSEVPKFMTALRAREGASAAIGFMCGQRNGITVLDVDSKDESVLADALDRHGQTPIIVRSDSGNHHAWYRWNGESRRIKAESQIDILGGGFVVAPPSRVAKGQYQLIQGSLDDLDRLPIMLVPPPDQVVTSDHVVGVVKQGERNKRLFNLCLRAARHCDEFDTLCDVARTRNSEFSPSLEDDEVMRTAASAWRYETEGQNYSGGMVAVFSVADVLPLMPDPYVAALLVWAKASFKPDGKFWIADGLAAKFEWSARQLRQARRRAIEMGLIRLIRPAAFQRPALYGFGPEIRKARREGRKERKVSVENSLPIWKASE